MAVLVETVGCHVLVGGVVIEEGHCQDYSEPLYELLTVVWRLSDRHWLQYALELTQ